MTASHNPGLQVGRKKVQRPPTQPDAAQKPFVPRPHPNAVAPFSYAVAAFLSVLAIAFGVWNYYPTISDFVGRWNGQSDYSFGYLIVPMALLLIWVRLDTFKGLSNPSIFLGFALLLVAIALRVASARFFMKYLDGISLVVWVAAMTAFIAGARTLIWASPAILLLVFMIPLPFGLEKHLSLQLQWISTQISCWCLQTMGYQAFAEGTVIQIDDSPMNVAEACSGLRSLLCFGALAWVFIFIAARPIWVNLIILISSAPIAIFSNSVRITWIGMFYAFSPDKEARKQAHDYFGLLMIPFAAMLFALLLIYLSWLFPKKQAVDMADILRVKRD